MGGDMGGKNCFRSVLFLFAYSFSGYYGLVLP